MKKNTPILICHLFDLPFLYLDISKQFLAPEGLSSECVQTSVMLTWGLQGASSVAPKAWAQAQNVINKSFVILL